MTGISLTARDRRTLLFGASCVLGLTLAFRGIPLWRVFRAEARASAAESMTQARQLEQALATFDEALDTLEARTTRLRALGPELLTGETAADMGANAGALLTAVARESLVRLDAVDIDVDTTRAPEPPRVTIQAQATGDVTALSAFLHALERGPALLAVRRLAVRSPRVEGAPDQAEVLSIGLTVEGMGLPTARVKIP